LAWAGVKIIASKGAAGLPALSPIGIHPRMLLFSAVLIVLTTLLFGFAPAVQTLRLNLTESLRDGSANASAGLRPPSPRPPPAGVPAAAPGPRPPRRGALLRPRAAPLALGLRLL